MDQLNPYAPPTHSERSDRRLHFGDVLRLLLVAVIVTIAVTVTTFVIAEGAALNWRLSSANFWSAVNAGVLSGCLGSLPTIVATLASRRTFRLPIAVIGAIVWGAVTGFCYFVFVDAMVRT